MILTNRLFERSPASKEAKSLYIFCEGAKRELDYFRYFKEMDSRINIEVYALDSKEDNSPLGLLEIAKKSIFITKENPKPKYKFQENDEIWIVLDRDKDKLDTRSPQLKELYEFVKDKKEWNIALSNPCFEVWLRSHFTSEMSGITNLESCTEWKRALPDVVSGGFDSRRHPIFIQDAIPTSKNHFEQSEGITEAGTTEMYLLAESMVSIFGDKINKALTYI